MLSIGVIPARMGSSRFPGKPLAEIAGKPMLAWCHDGAAASEHLDRVVIATCDDQIADWARAEGIEAVMTSDRHERATDRVVEAAQQIPDAEAVVLIQGDEPMIDGAMVDASLGPVLERGAGCTNLVKRIETAAEHDNPNMIKVVADLSGRALYFSRSPIPSPAQPGFDGLAAYKQVCVFGFSREGLLRFSELEPTPLEVAESVDMNRFLEHGVPIDLVETDRETCAVDIPDDIRIVEEAWEAQGAPGA